MEVNGTGALSSLSPDAFLNLFIEQLKHQDPTEPMDASQMMSQMAELTNVQQLNQLNAHFKSALASEQLALARELIGCRVRYFSGNAVHEGDVAEAVVEDGRIGVKIDGAFVSLGDIRGVLGPAETAGVESTADADLN